MILDQFLSSKEEKSFKEAKAKNLPGASETAVRSIVKSLSWRTVGTLDTILISWLITGEITLALSIGSIELVTKMALYFFHERLWNLIKWGKNG